MNPTQPEESAATSLKLRIVGSSMFPLLHPGDVVLANCAAYGEQEIARGDLVVFRHSGGPSGQMVKLAVGLPGEVIEVRNDRLWIDGRALDLHTPVVGSLPGRWVVGTGELFVLSYAPAVGTDSRSFGPIQRSSVLGQVWYVLPPSPRAGPLERVLLP